MSTQHNLHRRTHTAVLRCSGAGGLTSRLGLKSCNLYVFHDSPLYDRQLVAAYVASSSEMHESKCESALLNVVVAFFLYFFLFRLRVYGGVWVAVGGAGGGGGGLDPPSPYRPVAAFQRCSKPQLCRTA